MWGMERRTSTVDCAAKVAVLLSAAQGCTAKEIARTFGVAPGTVVKRLSVTMFKLGVNSQTAMIAEPMRRQIISPLCLLFMSVIVINAVLDNEAEPAGT
ncbi:LuxR C-terminal-related transcriptional regulator [Pseudomonas congelans]|uniref:LuxR C-terminal-related transcriptional regulator n=1 Tax=Pseudomonas congelans TaxID=200452 RepID=UPI0020291BDE|nr:LuxR C-terminal-related transcriptional regulator [Pseudomonas congelans]